MLEIALNAATGSPATVGIFVSDFAVEAVVVVVAAALIRWARRWSAEDASTVAAGVAVFLLPLSLFEALFLWERHTVLTGALPLSAMAFGAAVAAARHSSRPRRLLPLLILTAAVPLWVGGRLADRHSSIFLPEPVKAVLALLLLGIIGLGFVAALRGDAGEVAAEERDVDAMPHEDQTDRPAARHAAASSRRRESPP